MKRNCGPTSEHGSIRLEEITGENLVNLVSVEDDPIPDS